MKLFLTLLFSNVIFLHVFSQYDQYNAPAFIENKGQIADEDGNIRKDVHFMANFNNLSVFFTDQGVVYYYQKYKGFQEEQSGSYDAG